MPHETGPCAHAHLTVQQVQRDREIAERLREVTTEAAFVTHSATAHTFNG
jgi:hypothetical protein